MIASGSPKACAPGGDVWEIYAPAKVNLALDVLSLREDGYHDLRMLMLSVPLYDRITLRPDNSGVVSAGSDRLGLPGDRRNIAVRACSLYLKRTGQSGRGARLHIEKRIPMSAGLGGGSSDAAAVLRLLNNKSDKPVSEKVLEAWGLELGSDVPYCLRQGLCLAEGRGEILRELKPLPPCCFVLCTPGIAVSTRSVFGKVKLRDIRLRPDWKGLLAALDKGDFTAFSQRIYNVLEPLQAAEINDLTSLRVRMTDMGAAGVIMSGTGPTMLGLFGDEAKAQQACLQLRCDYPNTFFVKSS